MKYNAKKRKKNRFRDIAVIIKSMMKILPPPPKKKTHHGTTPLLHPSFQRRWLPRCKGPSRGVRLSRTDAILLRHALASSSCLELPPLQFSSYSGASLSSSTSRTSTTRKRLFPGRQIIFSQADKSSACTSTPVKIVDFRRRATDPPAKIASSA